MINAKLISVPFTCNGTALCITIYILFSYSLWKCFIHMGIFLALIPLPLLPWTWCADMNARLFDHPAAWMLCPSDIRSRYLDRYLKFILKRMMKMKRVKELLHNNEKEENKHGHNGGNSDLVSLLDLPDSVMVDIILRLPRETIFSCRLVCKQWLHIISELPFPNIHQDKLSSGPALLVVNGNNTFELLNFSVNDDDNRKMVRPTQCAVTFDLPRKGQSTLRVVDSCNGLICLSHSYCDDNDITLFVANPILGECVALPKPKRVKRQCLSAYAFGFNPSQQQYKVLSIVSEVFITHPNEERGEICALGIDSTWKSIGYLPFPDDERFVTVDGAFHWLAMNPQCRDYIYSYDIVREKYQEIYLPAPLCGVRCRMTLGVLFDCLCVVKSMIYMATSAIDIWVMKRYGDPSSWTKQYTLQFNYPMGFPARVWKNEEVAVWRSIFCPLRSYSLAKDTFIRLEVSNHRSAFDAVSYMPSLISLKNVMMVILQRRILPVMFLCLRGNQFCHLVAALLRRTLFSRRSSFFSSILLSVENGSLYGSITNICFCSFVCSSYNDSLTNCAKYYLL